MGGLDDAAREAIAEGVVVDARVGDVAGDAPAGGADWGEERTVDSAVLRAFLTETGTPPPAVVLRGVKVAGALNLEGTKLACPLYLRGCHLTGPVNIIRAHVPELEISRSNVPCVVADQAHVEGSLTFDSSTIELLSVTTARIDGQLSLNAVELTGGKWPCDLGDATLSHVEAGDFGPSQKLDGVALMADQLCATQGVYARDGFEARGALRFAAATVGGALDLDGALLHGPLLLWGAKVEGKLGLEGTTLDAGVDGRDATIERGVHGNGLEAASSFSLIEASVGTLSFEGASFFGPLTLAGAHVHGYLLLTDASLGDPARSLDASHATIDLGASCDGLDAVGIVVFSDCVITGGLTLDQAELSDELVVSSATIDGSLSLGGARLESPAVAVDLSEAKVTKTLTLEPVATPAGAVDLRHAHVGRLRDNAALRSGVARMRGFGYDDVAHSSSEPPLGFWPRGVRLVTRPPDALLDARDRIRWLKRDRDSGSQPFEALSGFYRGVGETRAARHVSVSGERRRRSEMNLAGKAWGLFLDGLVGFGFRSWQAGLYIALFTLLGARVFQAEYPDHFLAATPKGPDFHAHLYALDALVPVLDLQQRSAWVPSGFAETCFVVLTIAGWVLTTALVAGITAVLRRG